MTRSDFYIQDNFNIEAKKFEAAKGLYRTGNYGAALKIYLDMVNISCSYKLYYEIGRCYYKMNDMQNAEDNFRRSVSLETYKNPSYAYLGNICCKRGKISEGIENWLTAYSYKPEDESVCLNLAGAYFSRDMKFQSVYYYEKYLKYAADKTADSYLEIKKSIEEFRTLGEEFYKKAQKAVSMRDNYTAIQALETAVKNYPVSFDINYLLGKLCYEDKQYLPSTIYLKQAYCVDSRSLDVLQKLSAAMMHLGDYTGAYCCMKRMLPLVINNQKEYLDIIKTIKQLEDGFDNMGYQEHLKLAKQYYNDNNYYYALFEYENCLIIDGSKSNELNGIIRKLKFFINPEERIIKLCFEKGWTFYSSKNYKQSNKYFSKIMTLTNEDSAEYKLAKARLVDV